MNKRERLSALPRMGQNVMHVVDPIDTECGVRITRRTLATGVHEMVVQREIIDDFGRLWFAIGRPDRYQRPKQQCKENCAAKLTVQAKAAVGAKSVR